MSDMVWAALALMRLAIRNEQLEQELLRGAGGAGTASSSDSKPEKTGAAPDPATNEEGGVPGQP